MSDPTNFRQERIEKLLHELRYEVERGMMERDIPEEMGFRFYVPISNNIPDGVVFLPFPIFHCFCAVEIHCYAVFNVVIYTLHDCT